MKFLDETKSGRPANDIQFNIMKSGLGLLFPLKGHEDDHKYRVIGTVSHELLKSSKQLQFEDIQACFSQHVERKIHLYDPLWMSVYRTHHRYVEKFSLHSKYFL